MSQLEINFTNGRCELIIPLFDYKKVTDSIHKMADGINGHFDSTDGHELAVVCVLQGSVPLMDELYPRINHLRKYKDSIRVKSYQGTKSTGNLKILKELDYPVAGKHVLIVEDIVDTGRTLSMLCDLMQKRGATSVSVASLLDKPKGRKVEFTADWVGITLQGKPFIVGFGLDLDERYRELPYIGMLVPHHVNEPIVLLNTAVWK